LRDGLWAAAEGIVYDEWSRLDHCVDYFPIPDGWSRYWTVDFGYTNPFVWQAWAESPDGGLYRYREIYMTRRLVEDHAEVIKSICVGEPKPLAIICDHDAEDRATLERHLGMLTVTAYKAIQPGIDALKARLKVQDNGKPRIFFMRDSLVEVDRELVTKMDPLCTEDEFESYIWNKRHEGTSKGEVPVDKYNHGLDAARYMVAFADSLADDPQVFDGHMTFEDRVRISPY
jgi:phage terminase large subunit